MITTQLFFLTLILYSVSVITSDHSFRLQRTRLDSNLSVRRPGEAEKEKLHELEFNFGEYPTLIFLIEY